MENKIDSKSVIKIIKGSYLIVDEGKLKKKTKNLIATDLTNYLKRIADHVD